MFLTYRPAHLRDLQSNAEFIRDRFAYNENAHTDLQKMWRDLLRKGVGDVCVIEDRHAKGGPQVVWMCIRAFITEDYAKHLQTDAPALVGSYTLAKWKSGEADVIFQTPAQAVQNGGAAFVLMLNSGAQGGWLTEETLPNLSDIIAEFTYFTVGGVPLREVLVEMYDEWTCAWAEGAGYIIRRDDAHACVPVAVPSGFVSPRLYGINAEEGRRLRPGSISAAMFRYAPPQLGLSPAEQELLRFAWWHDTDEVLAELLGVSLATVKKRWAGIFKRAAQTMPDNFDDESQWAALGKGKRGAGKRHALINYIRQHIEELRPLHAPPAHDPFAERREGVARGNRAASRRAAKAAPSLK